MDTSNNYKKNSETRECLLTKDTPKSLNSLPINITELDDLDLVAISHERLKSKDSAILVNVDDF